MAIGLSGCLLVGLFVVLVGSGAKARAADGDWPQTVAELSDFRATSRSEQVLEFVDRLAARAPHIRRVDFGKTGENRPLRAVIVAQPPLPDPVQLSGDGRLVVLLVGNIHAGECDGKEALLMLIRELAQQPEHPWLTHLVLVCVPNFNADGNDRMRKDNRPGQLGPEDGMGERSNAQGLDLNRDFMKLDTPECQSLVALTNAWDPHLMIDTHTTNGSAHRYALTYDVPHNPASPARARQFLRQEMMPHVTRDLESRSIATFYYGNFNRDYTQWTTYGDEPRYSVEYFGLRGRLAILAESYAYITYQERIVATREFVRACLDFTASRAAAIRQLLDDVRLQAVTEPGDPGRRVPVQSEVRALDEKVVIHAYRRTGDSHGPGAAAREPQEYEVDFLTLFEAKLTVRPPYAYVLPAGTHAIAEQLRRHGIQLHRLSREVELPVESYRVKSLDRSRQVYQGHRATRVTVEPLVETRKILPGAQVILLAQPLSTLIVYLLEPQANDGLLAWDLCGSELGIDREYPVWRLAESVELPLE